jgi:BirA family biotin operon repressor/biotin-[acetyl-CoA-carboxylase] ligase
MLLICCKVTTILSEINVYSHLGEAVLYWTASCTSTQDAILELLNLPNSPSVVALFTDNQTAGRGQRGNDWSSIPDQSLSLTIALSINQHLERDWVLTNKILSACICETMEEKIDSLVQLKWPNDVFVSDKKMGGLLMQIHQDASGKWLLLGIGINVGLVPALVCDRATYLNAHAQLPISVAELAKLVVDRIQSLVLKQFWDAAFLASYREKYRRKLWRVNGKITVDFYENEQVMESKQATLLDVDDAGRVVLDLGNNRVDSFHHGRVRIATK